MYRSGRTATALKPRSAAREHVPVASAVRPRTGGRRPRRARSRDPARPARGGRPSGPGRTGSASMKSRRSAVQPGGSYGYSRNGPPPTPAATCRLASTPIPFVQVCGREPAVARQRQLADRPGTEHPGQDDVGLVDVKRVRLDGGQRLGERPGHLAARDPDPGRRRAQRSQPAQVRAGQRLLEPEDAVTRPGVPRSRGRRPDRATADRSPAIRQPWLRSTMIAIESPTAARVAVTAARPSSRRRGSIRILSAREALLAQADGRLGTLRGRQQHPARGVGGDGVRGAAEERGDGQPGDLADDVPQGRPRAASTGRRGSRSSRSPGRGGRWPADPRR